MSEGTSLEDIEAGNIAHTADSAVMSEILKDMNGMAPEQPQQYQPQYELPQALPQALPMLSQPSMQPPIQPQHYSPMMPTSFMDIPQPPQQSQHYQPVETPQPVYQPVGASLKKNTWSLVFEKAMDPLFVALLVGVLSLPAVHTWLAKYLKWAYHVGGALSWVGIVLQGLVAGLLFAGFQFAMGKI